MKTFLECYYKWSKQGTLPDMGLCSSLPYELLISEAWQMVNPNLNELRELKNEGRPSLYWGNETFFDSCYDLSNTRLNILLIAACLNGEKL